MRLPHHTLISISGLIWLAVGIFLLSLGLNLLTSVIPFTEVSAPLVHLLTPYVSTRDQIVLFLIAVSLGIGYLKGKYVLAKSAQRVTNRILSLPNPCSLLKMYNLPYCFLILGMMGLGMLIKIFGIPSDVRGVIDVAVGSALVNGSLIYFKVALETQKKAKAKSE